MNAIENKQPSDKPQEQAGLAAPTGSGASFELEKVPAYVSALASIYERTRAGEKIAFIAPLRMGKTWAMRIAMAKPAVKQLTQGVEVMPPEFRTMRIRTDDPPAEMKMKLIAFDERLPGDNKPVIDV